MNILMVCLGNICRSPLAEGIMRYHISKEALPWKVDSAGTGDWHVGNPPDARSVGVAAAHGIDISGQRARHFVRSDFQQFDHILVMDTSNMTHVLNMAATPEHQIKVRLILDLERTGNRAIVPDPYYGGSEGFEKVYAMLDTACREFIRLHR